MPFAVLAVALAAVASAGSVYLTLGMGLKACTLCFYQRAFAFALLGALATGLLAVRGRPGRVCLLGLVPALGGLGVAGFHVFLGFPDGPRAGADWYLLCPAGVGGIGTAPQQSFVVFALATLAVLGGAVAEVRRTGGGGAALLAGLALGVGAAAGSLVANPPMPAPVPADPAKSLDTCKPTLK